MKLTRRIQLDLTVKNTVSKNEIWAFLRTLNNDVFHACNQVVNHQYYNEIYTQKQFLKEFRTVDNEIKEIKKQLKATHDMLNVTQLTEQLERQKAIRKTIKIAQEKSFQEYHGVGQLHSTYMVLRDLYPTMPSSVLTAINHHVYNDFKANLFNVTIGRQTLRTYKKTIPIPFTITPSRLCIDDKGRYYLKWFNKIRFYLTFGKDDSRNKQIVNCILNEEFKLASVASIQLKDDKIFLLLVVEIPNKVAGITKKDLSVGVDLGINIPAYCALSEGMNYLKIGTKDDFLRVRLQMQARQKRLINSLKLTQGGKGKEKKLRALERINGLEKNFVNTYLHNISKLVVEFAKTNLAEVIKLEYLSELKKQNNNSYILKNWSFGALQSMIKYKAERAGIRVEYVDAHYTSTTCSNCGNHGINQRISQSKFICKNPACNNFGKEVSADYNAAVNIARSKKVIKHTSIRTIE